MKDKIPKYIDKDDKEAIQKHYANMVYKAINWEVVDELTKKQLDELLKGD